MLERRGDHDVAMDFARTCERLFEKVEESPGDSDGRCEGV